MGNLTIYRQLTMLWQEAIINFSKAKGVEPVKTAARWFVIICLILCMGVSAMPVKAHADSSIDKVLATISHVPVALMDVSNITAATSTPGCDIVSYRWSDSYGTMSGWFSTSECRVSIRIQAYDGYFFGENVAVYLNNEAVSFTRDPEGKYIDLTREYTPLVWAPTVIKHPGGETVEAGGWASFVATATYTSGSTWRFVSPEGKYFTAEELCEKFPGVGVEDNGEGKLKVYNIPAEMDGWKAVCRFDGPGGTVDSSGAKITVKSAAPAVTPSPEPAPEPTPEATPEPEKEEEQHEHSFSDKYSGDLMNHWQLCDCGETTEKKAHTMQWTVTKEAGREESGEEQGVCSVCGYSQTREIQPTGGSNAAVGDDESGLGKFGILIRVLLAIAGIVGGFILIMYIRYRARRKRARIRSRRY